MAILRKIRLKETYRPSELRKLGKRVHLFPLGKRTTRANQSRVLAFTKKHGGQVYTGHHSEADWTRVYYWSKGWHIVNRTGDYAVVL